MKIDYARIKEMIETNFAGDREIFLAAATAFLDGFEASLAELNDAMMASDIERVKRCAHRFKGESGLFHRSEVTELCKKVEAITLSGGLPDEKQLRETQAALKSLAVELHHVLNSDF